MSGTSWEEKCSTAQVSILRQSSGEAVRGQVSIPVLGFEWLISPPWLHICHLLLLLRINLPYELPWWLQWVFESASVSQLAVRGVISTVYITGGSGLCSPLCNLAFLCFARDVKHRMFPNVHLMVSACIAPVGRGAGVVCIDCWPFEMFGISNCLNFL